MRLDTDLNFGSLDLIPMPDCEILIKIAVEGFFLWIWFQLEEAIDV